MHLIKGHIVSLLYFALSTSSFTVFILLNILYSCSLSGSGNKLKKNNNNNNKIKNSLVHNCMQTRLISQFNEKNKNQKPKDSFASFMRLNRWWLQ